MSLDPSGPKLVSGGEGGDAEEGCVGHSIKGAMTRQKYFAFRATISIISLVEFLNCHWNACMRAHCRLCEALISKLRDARGLDERSVQRKPVPTFWQVAQSRVLCADSSKAITEREQSEDRPDHHDMAVQDAVPRFE